ncbi:hypothetical protein [Argonema galeatum]|uniref:hypothetical protein n=1 Tax=Argonema galeatum TaxID=2942762 RepID=UPI002010CF34|nr:hypothetical protein [Argonema galeatum]MCL1466231.1 hypothetical protein [Argonema galeatum A003/A1]
MGNAHPTTAVNLNRVGDGGAIEYSGFELHKVQPGIARSPTSQKLSGISVPHSDEKGCKLSCTHNPYWN